MKILVTGGAGFIGSHTVVELLLEGHEVAIVDNVANAKLSVIDRIAQITGVEPALHVVDILNTEGLDRVLEGGNFEAAMHFAGLKAVGESVTKPLDYYRINVGGSAVLFGALAKHGVKTVVFSSSCTVYGDPERVPITEDEPLKPPANPYGRTKQIIEQMLADAHRSDDGWKVAILRYFNPVGAHPSGLIGEDPNDIPNNLMPFITQVAAEKLSRLEVFGGDYPTRDGTGIRDYIHVVDLAQGHLAALDVIAADGGYHTWNLGTGEGTTVLEMVGAFERATSLHIPYEIVDRRPGDVAATWADPSRAEGALGWKASRSIEEMCADAWRWQQFALSLEEG